MRRVLYRVAASLDGYIAGPHGELDWIVPTPDDLAPVYAAVDTVLLGRRTYELTLQPGAPPWPTGWQIHVFSRTLAPEAHPHVTVVSDDAGARVASLRAGPGREIWLFGGSSLFRSLLEAKQVDLVEVAIMPVLLGGGIPLIEPGAPRTPLSLVQSRPHPSGVVTLRYEVRDAAIPLDRQPTLSGELITLRPLRAQDFDELFQVASDPLIWEQHPERHRYQEATFRAFFDEALNSGGALVATDRASGRIIGSSRYHGYDAASSVVEIGWSFLARAYWGGRYNAEMKRLMLEHAFRWVKRVIFIIGPDNRRSQRAVEKIGGVRAGTTTDAGGDEKVVYELTPALYARRHNTGSA
jgi:RimJ/RimL family protein N-acetyltransferase